MIYHLKLTLLSLCCLLASCSSNAPITSASSNNALNIDRDVVQEQPAYEKLIAQTPPNWQLIYELNNGDTRLSDFIPADEVKESWQTKLSFEAHKQLVDIDPISILMGEIEKKNETCTNISHSNSFSGLENNYPTSVRLILCGENAHTSQGEVSLTKAIQGQEYFYIIRIEKKVEVFEQGDPKFSKAEVAEWSNYLRQITLCSTSPAPDNQHGCPKAKPLEEKPS